MLNNHRLMTLMTSAARRSLVSAKPITPSIVRGPINFSDVTTARANLNAPSDANYVIWNPDWPVDRDLEDVFATDLVTNDILVLPERTQPYVIDSSEGFRAAGVQSVTGRNGELAIVNRYMGIRNARTWFAMARARRGILGLGPNAVVEVSASTWTQEPQIEDKNSVQAEGWVLPGRYYTDTTGTRRAELVGSQEKVIKAEHSSPYFGNFTMRARDLGGVAYSGLTSGKPVQIYEHLNLSGAWRGFSGVPNGEAGAITLGSGTYTISKCIVGARDSGGNRVGSSPIMINSSPGGLIEHTDTGESVAGMMTMWNCTGIHTMTNVNNRFNWGPGLTWKNAKQVLNLYGRVDQIGLTITAMVVKRQNRPTKAPKEKCIFIFFPKAVQPK